MSLAKSLERGRRVASHWQTPHRWRRRLRVIDIGLRQRTTVQRYTVRIAEPTIQTGRTLCTMRAQSKPTRQKTETVLITDIVLIITAWGATHRHKCYHEYRIPVGDYFHTHNVYCDQYQRSFCVHSRSPEMIQQNPQETSGVFFKQNNAILFADFVFTCIRN